MLQVVCLSQTEKRAGGVPAVSPSTIFNNIYADAEELHRSRIVHTYGMVPYLYYFCFWSKHLLLQVLNLAIRCNINNFNLIPISLT